jgi:SNF2 family DNA or RNA helicase
VPSPFKPGVRLQEHQLDAIRAFEEAGGAQILNHGLGSGKTPTSIGAAEAVRARHSGQTLVLTPKALVSNFQHNGLEKFLRPKARKNYTVVSIERFRRAPDKILDQVKPKTLVIDEAHRARTEAGSTYQALQHAAGEVPHRVVLTGSLVSNHPQDLAPLLGIARGKPLSAGSFSKHFIGWKKVTPGLVGRLRGVKPGEVPFIKNHLELRALTDKFVHRFSGSPAHEKHLPTFTEKDIEVPMSARQRRVYDYVLRRKLNPIARWMVEHNMPPGRRQATSILSALSGAREVANSPHVADKSIKVTEAVPHSPKLHAAFNAALDHLRAHPKHKVVVYSNFRKSTLDPLFHAFTQHKHNPAVFHGGVKEHDRQQHIHDFNHGKKRVLLVSPSGAEGLDLKGATLFQRIDPHWNPERMSQAQGRVIRFKSHEHLPPHLRHVKVENYRSVLPKRMFGLRRRATSVDEWVENRAKEKRHLNSQLMGLIPSWKSKTASTADNIFETFQRTLTDATSVNDGDA